MPIQSVKKTTLVVLLIFMVGVGGAWANQPAPQLILDQTEFSFEPVVDGTLVNHDFMVQNKGDAVLNIHKVKTG
jgi:hypothetical protein